MYVILYWENYNYKTVKILSKPDGIPNLFGSYDIAKKYAKNYIGQKECYKVRSLI